MLYIDQVHTLSFAIGLVKTESGFIVIIVESGFWRWMLVVAVISVDAYLFFGFLRPDLSFEDTRVGVFWLHCAAW